MKFSTSYDVTKEKDAAVIEEVVLMQFAASYINQFKDKYNYQVVIEEVDEEIDGKKVKKKYARVSMDMIEFRDVLKPKRDTIIIKEKASIPVSNPKEKSESGE